MLTINDKAEIYLMKKHNLTTHLLLTAKGNFIYFDMINRILPTSKEYLELGNMYHLTYIRTDTIKSFCGSKVTIDN